MQIFIYLYTKIYIVFFFFFKRNAVLPVSNTSRAVSIEMFPLTGSNISFYQDARRSFPHNASRCNFLRCTHSSSFRY